MTIPEQPGAPALTRKQMREIRNTGSNPIITTDAAPEATPAPVREPAPAPAYVPPVPPLPRAAEPVVVPERPVPDAAVDLGVSPLTRRQARQQEMIRTASVPVITPEVAAAHTAASAAVASASTPPAPAATPAAAPEADTGLNYLFGSALSEKPATEEPVVAEPTDRSWAATAAAAVAAAAATGQNDADEPDDVHELFSTGAEEPAPEAAASERAVVSPLLGAGLLAAEPAHVELPPSFDQLLARSTSGSVGTPNALIVSQASSASPIVAPVTATGEVLITGTLNLPEGLGSNGHAPGVADGKDVDAVLIDGEIPAHSSPTPIAASAAISTVKNSGEIIQPPAPEKGSKLMMTLAITAGVLALALVGVLILAFVTGAL